MSRRWPATHTTGHARAAGRGEGWGCSQRRAAGARRWPPPALPRCHPLRHHFHLHLPRPPPPRRPRWGRRRRETGPARACPPPPPRPARPPARAGTWGPGVDEREGVGRGWERGWRGEERVGAWLGAVAAAGAAHPQTCPPPLPTTPSPTLNVRPTHTAAPASTRGTSGAVHSACFAASAGCCSTNTRPAMARGWGGREEHRHTRCGRLEGRRVGGG